MIESGGRLASQDRAGAIAWLAACFLLVPAGSAAGRETMRLPAFGEVVDVRVVNLEVVVTRRGERVTGLTAEDFSLRVDGVEVEVEFFTEVAGGRTVATPAPDPRTIPSGLSPGAAVGTRYVLFIDDDFAIPTARNRVLERLAEQMSGLGDDDRVAVVAFDGRRLELLCNWTRSLSRLRAVLEEAQQRRTYGMLRRSELKNRGAGRYGARPPIGRNFSNTGFLGLGRALEGAGDPEVLRYSDSHGEISQVVRAATSTLRGFSASPDRGTSGRKVMLLLAGGWPAYARWGDRDIFDRLESERALFAPLVDTANRLGFTLYPVDVQGGTYDTRGRGAEYGTLTTGRAGALAEQERERLSEDALYYLAEETGGRAILGGARLEALERTIEDTRSYYWLGFTPAWKGDGEGHRLEVEARSRGRGERLKVRTRRSFSDFSRQSQVSMWIESAHLFDLPLPGSTELAVEIGEPQPAGLGKLLLPLALEVPLDQVTVLPVADSPAGGQRQYAASLELRVAATDADGASADVPVRQVEIVSEGPPEPGQVEIHETRLKLRRKPHRLLITLYDPLTGGVMSRRVDFEP